MARTAETLKTEESDVDMADLNMGSHDSTPDAKSPLKRSPSVSVPPTPLEMDSAKPSPSPIPGSASKAKSETPTPRPQAKAKPGVQFIGDLPSAEEDALKTFVALNANAYQYGTLGRSREALESMTCDCAFAPGVDDPDMACGADSDCINRLTQVECLEDDCRCRVFCRNQRMQRKEYASIEIVQTEKKGFGLRAGSNIAKDGFIYEYIGEVVSQPSFVKRMRDYADEGIRHFYFMMLQKDEFIDATKRGGIGRFANHSCNPNCYVAKWTVGQHVRMGIYAKRNIKKDEELTFNYNVDRYGHDAQPCYCGEPNCVGFLGGKTQTDVAAMDDLYLDALGISEEVEMYGLKGSKKKKGKKLDEDYTPILKPIETKETTKVVQAIKQVQNKKLLLKMLTRIKMTEDEAILRQIMRLRGYSLMCNVLEENLADIDICSTIMELLMPWPLLQRNKVDDSKIEEPVRKLEHHENEKVKTLANTLLEHWNSLETGYRIPKRLKGDEQILLDAPELFIVGEEPDNKRVRQGNTSEFPEIDLSHISHLKPLGRRSVKPGEVAPSPYAPPPRPKKPKKSSSNLSWGRTSSDAESLRRSRPEEPPKVLSLVEQQRLMFNQAPSSSRTVVPTNIPAIIASAARKAQETRKLEEERAVIEAAEAAKKLKRAKERELRQQQKSSKEGKSELKEKRLQKLVGAVVVKCLSKYRDRMDREEFKKQAKELTCLIAEKEKKSSQYQSGKLDSLSEEKVAKIKKFAKDYIAKVIRKMEKRNSTSGSGSHQPSGSGDRSALTSQPNGSTQPEMSVEDALDLGGDLEDDYAQDEDEDEASGDPSPASDANGHGPGPAVGVVGHDVDVDADAERDVEMDETPFVSPKRSRWDQGPSKPDSAIASDL